MEYRALFTKYTGCQRELYRNKDIVGICTLWQLNNMLENICIVKKGSAYPQGWRFFFCFEFRCKSR